MKIECYWILLISKIYLEISLKYYHKKTLFKEIISLEIVLVLILINGLSNKSWTILKNPFSHAICKAV